MADLRQVKRIVCSHTEDDQKEHLGTKVFSYYYLICIYPRPSLFLR